jgi:carbamoyl-phosphate synthase large subunit
VFVSVANRDKRHMIFPVKRLADLGFEIFATEGTADVLRRNGVEATTVRKSSQGPGPNGEPTIVQMVQDGGLDLIVNTPIGITQGGSPRIDGYEIRSAAVARNIPCITTVQGLAAAVQGIEAQRAGDIGVRSLQDWTSRIRGIADLVKPADSASAEGGTAASDPSGKVEG